MPINHSLLINPDFHELVRSLDHAVYFDCDKRTARNVGRCREKETNDDNCHVNNTGEILWTGVGEK
jgi:hypothetical protein